jgi:hypothetical protein
MLAALAVMMGVYFLANLKGGGSHGFSLLYATLFQLTPDEVTVEPGVAPYLLPLRDEAIGEGENSTDLVAEAKQISDALVKYLQEKCNGRVGQMGQDIAVKDGDGGAVVTEIARCSAAADGLRTGDVITEIADLPVSDAKTATAQSDRTAGAGRVMMKVRRGDKTLRVAVVREKVKERVKDIEERLSIDILKHQPFAVLMMPWVKFHLACDGWPSGADFSEHILRDRQPQAITRLGGMCDVIGHGLTGGPQGQAAVQAFSTANYDPARMTWFTAYEEAWSRASIALRLPDREVAKVRWAHDFISVIPNAEHVIPGVPVYFLLAWAGMAWAILKRGPLRWVQAIFIVALLATWYAATMVGVTNARFRFAYDPFCYMYAIGAVVWACDAVCRLIGKKNAEKSL